MVFEVVLSVLFGLIVLVVAGTSIIGLVRPAWLSRKPQALVRLRPVWLFTLAISISVGVGLFLPAPWVGAVFLIELLGGAILLPRVSVPFRPTLPKVVSSLCIGGVCYFGIVETLASQGLPIAGSGSKAASVLIALLLGAFLRHRYEGTLRWVREPT